tara:strand:+ start:2767 stop:2988 length:222 start_codon:yes stop_codon:yes gene_type:complete
MDNDNIITEDEVQQNYNAAMDSVNLINSGKADEMDQAEWDETVARNVAHLKIMVNKDYWTTQDLAPLNDAIAG